MDPSDFSWLTSAWKEVAQDGGDDRKRLLDLIRNTQKVTVKTDWHLLSAEERQGLSLVLTETQQRRCPWLKDNPGFKRLLQMVSSESPWNLEDIAHILGERGERVQKDFFSLESPSVLLERVRVLHQAGLQRAALNLASFILANHGNKGEGGARADAPMEDDDAIVHVFAIYAGLAVQLKRTAHISTVICHSLSWSQFVRALDILPDSEQAPFPPTVRDAALNMLLVAGQELLLLCDGDEDKDEDDEDDKEDEEVSASEGDRRAEDYWRHVLPGKRGAGAVRHTVEVFEHLCKRSAPFYSAAQQLWKQGGSGFRSEVVSLSLRGIAIDLNKLEAVEAAGTAASLQKEGGGGVEASLASGRWARRRLCTETRLARHLSFLSDSAVQECMEVARECALTAFSLNPSSKLLQKLQVFGAGEKEEGEGRPEDISGEREEMRCKKRLRVDEAAFEEACGALCNELERLNEKRNRGKAGHEGMVVSPPPGGLISIQGELLTSHESYDPMACPLEPFRRSWPAPLTEQQLRELLVAVSAARWHLLSWALGWRSLEQRCQELLRDPTSKRPKEELKHLVIDYTQFDEWSSDEEGLDATAGIEAGYEHWQDREDDDEEREEEQDVEEAAAAITTQEAVESALSSMATTTTGPPPTPRGNPSNR